MRSYAGDQLSHVGHRIHEDARLQRNDVSIEAGGAHVDATLATRWRRVVETLGRDLAWDGRSLPPIEETPTTPGSAAAAIDEPSAEDASTEAPPLPEQTTTAEAPTADLSAEPPRDTSPEVLPEATSAPAMDAALEEDIPSSSEPQTELPSEALEIPEILPEEAAPEPSTTDAAAPEVSPDVDWSEDPLAHLTDDTPLPGVDGLAEGEAPPEGEA